MYSGLKLYKICKVELKRGRGWKASNYLIFSLLASLIFIYLGNLSKYSVNAPIEAIVVRRAHPVILARLPIEPILIVLPVCAVSDLIQVPEHVVLTREGGHVEGRGEHEREPC